MFSLPRHHLELQEIKKPSARSQRREIGGLDEPVSIHTTDGKEKVAQEAENVNAYLDKLRKYSLFGREAEQDVVSLWWFDTENLGAGSFWDLSDFGEDGAALKRQEKVKTENASRCLRCKERRIFPPGAQRPKRLG